MVTRTPPALKQPELKATETKAENLNLEAKQGKATTWSEIEMHQTIKPQEMEVLEMRCL